MARPRILREVDVEEVGKQLQLTHQRKREVYREAYRLGLIDRKSKSYDQLSQEEKSIKIESNWDKLQTLMSNHLNK